MNRAKSIVSKERNKIAIRFFCIQFWKINFAIQHLLINEILLIFFEFVELPCQIVLGALIETSHSLRELIYLQYIWEKIWAPKKDKEKRKEKELSWLMSVPGIEPWSLGYKKDIKKDFGGQPWGCRGRRGPEKDTKCKKRKKNHSYWDLNPGPLACQTDMLTITPMSPWY